MFWFLYIIFVLIFSYLISYISNRKFFTFYIFLVSLLTPAQVEIGSTNYAPALFTFLFNLLFDQGFSLRVLRPLLVSLPLSFFCLWLFLSIKRKFSLS